jgi:hypothetical protein
MPEKIERSLGVCWKLGSAFSLFHPSYFVLSSFFLSTLPFKMPRSKKGRLSGDARKEINATRIADMFKLLSDIQRGRKTKDVVDFAFARVVKALGANHMRVAIDGPHGPFEIIARIPNIYARRGATPVTTRSVVTIYTGTGFDAKTYTPKASDQFDITAILGLKDTQKLRDLGYLPDWMMREADAIYIEGAISEGYEFDYSGGLAEEDEDDEDDDEDDEDDDSEDDEGKPRPLAGGGSASATPGAAEMAEAEEQKKRFARAAKSRAIGRAAARERVEKKERGSDDDIDIDAI